MRTLTPLVYNWYWQLKGNPEQVWAIVTNTRRINEDAGTFERFSFDYKVNEEGIVLKETKKNSAGKNHTFTELPFEWEYPKWYQVTRHFHTSPMASLYYKVELINNGDQTTTIHYKLQVQPRNRMAAFLLSPYLSIVSKRGMDKAFAAIAKDCERLHTTTETIIHQPKKYEANLTTLDDVLNDTNSSVEFRNAIHQAVSYWSDNELLANRPYEFADIFSLPRRETLRSFLKATHKGLFRLEWRMFCPSCHGSGEQSTHQLSAVNAASYCPACHISYEALFDQGIEATFCPQPSVRDVSGTVYCTGGPQETKHILVQRILHRDETICLKPDLAPGVYAIYKSGFQLIAHCDVSTISAGTPQNRIAISVSDEISAGTRIPCSERPEIHLTNTGVKTMIQMHRITDLRDIATAAEVTTLTEFRRLFSSQLIKDGERFAVSHVTVMFTDLRESTKLYRKLGDVEAISRIQEHFDILRFHVQQQYGTVIKTIGDAVMAVFYTPGDAIEAAKNISIAINENNKNHNIPLSLKLGIHSGEAFALTFDQKIDYFGTTVNYCSRLEKMSRDHHFVISDALFQDQIVRRKLAEISKEQETFTDLIRGISDHPQTLHRICLKT